MSSAVLFALLLLCLIPNKELKIEIEKLTNIVTSNENLTIDKDKDKSKLKKENKIKKQKRNINQQ